MAQEDNKMEMEILCKRNGSFCSDQLEWKKWNTSKSRPFVMKISISSESYWH